MSAYMADIPNLNPSGKQQAMENESFIHKHRDLVANPQFQQSMNLAMIQYQGMLAQGTTDSNGAAANMFKLKGAQEFMHQFLYLAEEFKPVAKPTDSGKLDYKA